MGWDEAMQRLRTWPNDLREVGSLSVTCELVCGSVKLAGMVTCLTHCADCWYLGGNEAIVQQAVCS